MVLRLLFFSLLIGYVFPSSAQNLVVNGSFEADSCSIFWSGVTGWLQLYSADHYHLSCNQQRTYKTPHKGRGCVGLYNGGFSTWPPSDTIPSREYIIGRLVHPLEKGKKYSVSYWVKPSSYFDAPWENMTTNSISLAFMEDTSEINMYQSPPPDYVINIPPTIQNPHGVLRDFDQYLQIEECYTATGGEQWLMIGNFNPLFEAPIEPLSEQTIYDYSYFMIDEVEVREIKTLAIPPDTTLCESESLHLDLQSFEEHQFWLNGTSIQDSIVITASGEFDVHIELGSCRTDQFLTTYDQVCQNCQFYVPNVFTPNGDGINDRLEIFSNCDFKILEAQVYNRWGAQVFSSNQSFSWDGFMNNSKLDTGTYIYAITVMIQTPLNQEIVMVQGEVSIIK